MSIKKKRVTEYRKSHARKVHERKVNLVVRNLNHDYTTSLHCSIARFCEEVVDLSAREVYAAMFEAERRGQHVCQVGNWEFSWMYMDELRQEMITAGIYLYDRGIYYKCFVNTDSKKKCDVDFHNAILLEADNYSKGII